MTSNRILTLSLESLLQLTQGSVVEGFYASESERSALLLKSVSNIQSLENSTSQDVAFFFNPKYQAQLLKARPLFLVVGTDFVQSLLQAQAQLKHLSQTILIECKNPYLAMAKVLNFFKTESDEVSIHPTAVVESSARIGKNVSIGPHCWVGHEVTIGDDTKLFAGVKIYDRSVIGQRCRIHAGVVIGSDGFGYVPLSDGHYKIHHIGRVLIGDDVEIGANSTIDRGTMDDTKIASQVKIDNCVHIGHNAQVGRGSILCGMAGLAGNAKLGEFVTLGGKAAVSNLVTIGDRAQIGGGGMVSKDVPAGESWTGYPARPLAEHLKILANLNRLFKNKKK